MLSVFPTEEIEAIDWFRSRVEGRCVFLKKTDPHNGRGVIYTLFRQGFVLLYVFPFEKRKKCE